MFDKSSIVAIFDQHAQTEAGLKCLQEAGFDMKKISIVGKDDHSEEDVIGYYNSGNRMSYRGSQGALWGGFWSLLFGSALFIVPGIGPLLVAGPLVVWIVAALESAAVAGGFSVLGAALVRIGIPENSIPQYETSIKDGKFLILVHGTPDEVTRAKNLLTTSGASKTEAHFAVHEDAIVALA